MIGRRPRNERYRHNIYTETYRYCVARSVWGERLGAHRCCSARGGGGLSLENAVIARTAPGLELFDLDQDLAEGRRHKQAIAPRRRINLSLLWQRRAIELATFARGLIRPGGPPLWQRWTVGARGWCESLGARWNPCRPF